MNIEDALRVVKCEQRLDAHERALVEIAQKIKNELAINLQTIPVGDKPKAEDLDETPKRMKKKGRKRVEELELEPESDDDDGEDEDLFDEEDFDN